MIKGRLEGNPAEYTGVVVYQPDYDSQLQYNADTKGVVDPASGNKFWMNSPHGDNLGRFGLATSENMQIVQGAYYIHSATLPDGTRAVIYDVASTYLVPPGDNGISFIPFDVRSLARFFRVISDREKPIVSRSFIVVDSRPIRGLQPVD